MALGSTKEYEQLKTTIKLKWLCPLLVHFHCGAALVVSCPHLCWKCPDNVAGVITSSSDRILGPQSQNLCVPSQPNGRQLGPSNIESPNIYSRNVSDWGLVMDERVVPQSSSLKKFPRVRESGREVVCLLKQQQSCHRKGWGDEERGRTWNIFRLAGQPSSRFIYNEISRAVYSQ